MVQLYLAARDRSLFACPRRLVGFQRVSVPPGEMTAAHMRLDFDAFRVWDRSAGAWVAVEGLYDLFAASSSRDMRLHSVIELAASSAPFDVHDYGGDVGRTPVAWPAPYVDVPSGGYTRAMFDMLNGGPAPEPDPVPPYTKDSPVTDLAATFLGRRVLGLVRLVLDEPARKLDRDQREMMREMARDMPLRSMITSGVPAAAVDGFVEMLNGRRLRGFASMMKGLAQMLHLRDARDGS